LGGLDVTLFLRVQLESQAHGSQFLNSWVPDKSE